MKIAILGAECTGKTQLAQALSEQLRRVQAQPTAPLLLCDTTPLMTAIYSELLLGDASLYPQALQAQRSFDITLVTALDLPWVGDGIQRDGPDVRNRVDGHLRAVLQRHGIGYSMVYGTGEARAQCALQAIHYALGTPRPKSPRSAWSWPCEKCSDPDCEHRLFRDLSERDGRGAGASPG